MTDENVKYAFMIVALLIVVTYFVGAATDVNALSAGFTKLWYAATGKTATGATSNYPTGATYSSAA